jgi:hypothetical protein
LRENKISFDLGCLYAPEGARQARSVSGKSRGSELDTRFISTSVKYTKAEKEEQGEKQESEHRRQETE